MKPNRYIILLAIPTLLFTGCIHIEEYITFNKKGHGVYRVKLDFGMAVDAIKVASERENRDKFQKLLDRYIDNVNQASESLLHLKGISKVSSDFDTTSWIVNLNFHFENLTALNLALSSILKGNNDKTDPSPFFEARGKKLIRTQTDYLTNLLTIDALENTRKDLGSFFVREVYAESKVTFEGTIVRVTNNDYRLVGNNTVSWKKYMFSKRDESMKLETEIKVKATRFRRK